MSPPYRDFVNELQRHSRWIEKQKNLHKQGLISSKDVNMAYEIAFLSSYISFEIFIERQFVGLLVGNPYYKGKPIQRRIEIKSERVARDVIKGTNNFPRYLPVDSLKKLADIYFPKGHPFDLDKDVPKNALNAQENTLRAQENTLRAQKKTLADGQYVRNYIAHKTHSAKEKLDRHVLKNADLRSDQKSAAGYLRSQVSEEQDQDRLGQMIADIAGIAKKFVE